MIRKIDLFGKTNESGALTVETNHDILGELVGVHWLIGGFSAGVKFVLKVDDDGTADYDLLTITGANTSKHYYPRAEACDGTGGDADKLVKFVINGALKLSITSGGSGKEGGAIVFVR